MIFPSLFFLFLFLPVSLNHYYVVPSRFRTIPMLVMSLLFYAWGTPEYLVLIIFSILFNYISALEIADFQERERFTAARVIMIIAVAVNVLILGFFKYYGFLLTNINALTGLHLQTPELGLPLGISFYTFTVLSYVLDVYRGRAGVQKNILSFSVYVTFFPKVISGPIVQYKDMEAQLKERTMAPAKLGSGLNMFLVGLFKKVLIADNLGTAFAAISGMTAMSAGTAWLGMIFYGLELYFDFSSYSDMAIGLAKMFGFDFAKNFDHPYLSANISEFWRRWHISLGAWFRDYIYIPLGGNRCSSWANIRNLLIVWLLTGLWHGASWNFIVWGLYHGAFVLLDKYVLKDRVERVPKFLRIAVTAFVVFFGWVLFFSPSMPGAIHYYGQMFGMGHMGLIDSVCKYYFSGNVILVIAAVLGCGSLVQRLHQRLVYRSANAAVAVSIVMYVVLLMLCVACLVNATYSSFLYFQF